MFNDDKLHGVMFGNEWPNIRVTSNGGNNWISVNTGTDINDFCTASWVSGTDVVFICSSTSPSNNKIIRSDDNGLTWQQQSTPNLAIQELDNIRYGNKFVGFAITNEGYVLKSIQNVIPVLPQDTIRVPTDYTTIQAAIDAAIDGNTILVADGIYYENINYKGKAITVASHFLIDGDTSHISNTIIDGSQASNPDSASVVEFNSNEDSTSVLCGFTITGGSGTDWGYYIYGGGIILTDASPIIRNNIIEYNTLRSDVTPLGGSAIALGLYSDKTLIIENNIIRNNLCESASPSVYVNGTIFTHQTHGTVIFRETILHNNLIDGEYITNGGAISGFGNNSVNGTLIIENNIITQNIVDEGTASTAQLGGGIFLEAYIAYVRNNIITYNSARGGGGIWYYTPSPLPQIKTTLANNLIYGNIAGSRQGGGVSTHHDYDIINCIIWGNTTPQFNYQQAATINWSNIEETYPIGSNNISIEPDFLDTTYFLLSNTSPCIDMGNPDPM